MRNVHAGLDMDYLMHDLLMEGPLEETLVSMLLPRNTAGVILLCQNPDPRRAVARCVAQME